MVRALIEVRRYAAPLATSPRGACGSRRSCLKGRASPFLLAKPKKNSAAGYAAEFRRNLISKTRPASYANGGSG
jgi:hypothetical protein